LTPILVSFYRNLQPKDKNILLAYLVFPLVLNSDFLEKITTVSRASRLSRITNDKEIMAGFEERFEYFKDITNHCLQYALECGYIKINDDLSVTVLVDNNLQIDCRLSKSINLASQLHKIFTRNVINTYYAFGIYKL
ncbi:three component ABC system middle component, partial [Phocaeicola barnesiae]|uniref:three component ABC system middle component n=1 Tax=Phocaeicola barnesiae TaxID=376804 RepID=UPI001F1FFA1E